MDRVINLPGRGAADDGMTDVEIRAQARANELRGADEVSRPGGLIRLPSNTLVRLEGEGRPTPLRGGDTIGQLERSRLLQRLSPEFGNIELREPGRRRASFSGRFFAAAESWFVDPLAPGGSVRVSRLEVDGTETFVSRNGIKVLQDNGFVRIEVQVTSLVTLWRFTALQGFLDSILSLSDVEGRSVETLRFLAVGNGRSVSADYIGLDEGSPTVPRPYNGANFSRFFFPPVQPFPFDFRPTQIVVTLEILT